MRKYFVFIGLFIICIVSMGSGGCETNHEPPKSASGVQQTQVQVTPQSNGKTTEQNNIAGRIDQDNKPGSIKHLYIISPYSGQVLLYSTVKGKVTSSGKRLTPTSVATSQPNTDAWDGIPVEIGGMKFRTSEVLQDDGTYGSSDPYIYWFDSRGIYHQHYVTGGQIIHVSSEPLAVKSVVINVEQQ